MPSYQFNSQQYEPKYGGGLGNFPPAKKMKVIIFESELKNTAKGDGGYLQFLLRCVEGPLAGSEGFDNLNLHNQNAQTVKIANNQLSAYCHVLGVYQFNDTAQLHNIPFLIDVDWQKGQEPSQAKPEGGYTQVTALYDANGNPPGKAGQGPQRAAPVPTPPAVVAASPAPQWTPPQAQPAPQVQPWAQQGGNAAPAPNNWNNR